MQYNFTKLANLDRLKKEILDSVIATALDYITLEDTNLNVYFKSTLSTEDEAILGTLVNEHVNEPLPSETLSVQITQTDTDTSGVAISPRWAPIGWHQVYHEVEFETSKLNSIHDKTWENIDTGYSSIKFYDANGDELTTQGEIDTDCVMTHFDFMPTFDFAIKSGVIAQITTPNVPIYLWVIGAPGIMDKSFCNGGINLEFVNSKSLVGLDGTAATIMPYSHPQLGAGQGTNKIRFIVRHPAGFQHRIQAIFEYFKA